MCLLEFSLSADSSLALGINIRNSVEGEHLTFKLVLAELWVRFSVTEVFPIPSHRAGLTVSLPH